MTHPQRDPSPHFRKGGGLEASGKQGSSTPTETRDWRWALRHINRPPRKDGSDFYDAAGKWGK